MYIRWSSLDSSLNFSCKSLSLSLLILLQSSWLQTVGSEGGVAAGGGVISEGVDGGGVATGGGVSTGGGVATGGAAGGAGDCGGYASDIMLKISWNFRNILISAVISAVILTILAMNTI